MRIFETIRIGLVGLGVFAMGECLVTPSLALDANAPANPAPITSGPFKSVTDAFRSGMKDYNAGDKTSAVKALEYAAGQGHAMARWKLGRMYADGDGVPSNPLKAYEQFSKIANDFADEPPDSPNSRFVANAFVALGGYYLDGIPSTYVKPNPQRAREMFSYAASFFGDPDAQYNVGRMNLDGVGGSKDVKQALRWFNLSAEKGHVQAQAMLGHLLFNGEGGIRQRARGLMWLTLARESCDATRDAWIVQLQEEAMTNAADTDRLAAMSYMQQHAKKQ
jgi:TPR repeat protein